LTPKPTLQYTTNTNINIFYISPQIITSQFWIRHKLSIALLYTIAKSNTVTSHRVTFTTQPCSWSVQLFIIYSWWQIIYYTRSNKTSYRWFSSLKKSYSKSSFLILFHTRFIVSLFIVKTSLFFANFKFQSHQWAFD
jgi:hypothetical protein